MEKHILHTAHRVVTYNERDKTAGVSIPKSFQQPGGIRKHTHRAYLIYCRETLTRMTIEIFNKDSPITFGALDILHQNTASVVLGRSNILVKIPAIFTEPLHVDKRTHRITWICYSDRSIKGIIYPIEERSEFEKDTI
jgi:hypothetical protein